MQNDILVNTGRSGSGWSKAWGILMVICGILAIALPLASSIGVVFVVGWLILLAGVWHLIFIFHSRSFGGVLWQLLLAVVYGFAGIYMLMHPLLGLVTLTFVIAIFLFIEAGLETALYFTIRKKANAGWVLFDAIITLILAIMIWSQWPSSSAWVLGMLVGISLIFSGISRFSLSTATHQPAVMAPAAG
jgi:uncharacterized membrane protein HdeD (DUF308 family)